MSMIDTMSIMGVRAFGPDDENQQVIKFQHPLTLLVGPNGAGKTTIIECLKYASTGEHPINTKGGAFVHDPKLARDFEVKAKVRLKCKTVYGHEILVERGMVLTQKLKSTQFKTLDGIITKIKNDEKVSITSKCADLNKEMVSALGVSKAVLDNVIFCHQEESNWPLGEGKSVKQRFDDIFAATRYIKALDEIRKIQRDRKSKKDLEEVELKHLKANTDRAKDIRNKLAIAEKQLTDAKSRRTETEEALNPVRDRLSELSRRRQQVIQLDGELGALKSRREQMIKDRKKLESRINNLFNGTDEELLKLQENQEGVLEMKKQKQIQCERKLKPLQLNIDELNSAKNKLSIEQGKLQQEVKGATELKNMQSRLIKQVVEDTDMHVSFSFNSDLSSDNVEEFENLFEKFKTNEMKQMKNRKTELERAVKETDEEYQSSWKALTETSEGKKHKDNALKEIKNKSAQTTRELNRIRSSGDRTRLDALQQQINSHEADLEEAQMGVDFNLLREELKEMQSTKSSLEEEMTELDDKLMRCQKTSQTQTKLDLLEKDFKSKEMTTQQLKSRIESPLSQLDLPSCPNKKQLSSWIQEKVEDLNSLQQELNQKKSNLTKISTELAMVSKQMKQKRSRQSELDETLFEVCGSQDLDQDMTQLESEIKNLQGKKGLTDGIQHMYRKFIGDMKDDSVDKREITCPLCQRLFDESSEVDELIAALQGKLDVAPKKLENQSRDLEKKQTRYKLLQQNRPLKTEFDRLVEREIPDLEKRSSQLAAQSSVMQKEVDALESQRTQLSDDVTTARSHIGDVARIDSLQAETRELSRAIKQLQKQLPQSSRMSIDELQEEKKNLSVNLNKISKLISENSQNLQLKVDQINNLKDKVNKAKEEKLKLASDLQKVEQLQSSLKSLNDEIIKIKREIEESESQLEPLTSATEESKKRRMQATRRRDEHLNDMNRRKQELDSKWSKIDSVNRDIRNFEEKGIEHQLRRNASRAKDLQMRIDEANLNLQQSHDEIKKLEKDHATCTDRQRDLEDNVALRERRRDIDAVEKDVARVEEQLGGLDVTRLEKESRQLQKKYENLNEDKIGYKEKEIRYRDESASLKSQLNEDDYKNAEDRHRECLVKCAVFDMVSSDLSKYYKALDRAVMRYHHIKMEEINKIIKDLWQETYRGRDIDYIEICSNEDTGTSAGRRVYNYRVVMYFEGVAMDMRGRCSAGQKVLASLVIRLALAETFCINCGILALDEPTTNLDRDNIESLAKSLVSIIESRSQQRNFQLLVITHDEDFVDLLGRSSYVDHFYRIEKNDRGRSRIFRCPIRDLES